MQSALSFLLVFLSALTLACQTPGGFASSSDRGLARVVETGVLRVGMTGDQLPMNFRMNSGEWIGFEVAVLNVLGKNLGVRTTFVQKPFAELLPALEAGDVDIVMSGMTINPRRNRRVAFVGPYFVSGKSILAKRALIDRFRAAGALGDADVRLVALAGSTSESYVDRVAPKAQLERVERLSDGLAMLLEDRVDALVADYETCALARLRNPDADLAHLERPLTVEPMGIALNPGDTLLANLLENYLEALVLSGGLERIHTHWFETGRWLAESTPPSP